MDINFVRERITQLRMAKGISEYQMSYDLGHSRGYINTELFAICDYFQITPAEFFDPSMGNPTLKKHVVSGLDLLSERDLQLIQSIIAHLIQRG